jgi:uroporphyrinogen-III decarboxylase
MTHLLPGISDLGVDILDVDHMVDMRLVRRTMGDKVILTGNLDPVSVVKNGTPDLIRNALHKVYKEVGNPYMINAGCEIPSGTPVENLRALCEEIPFIR